MPRAANRQRTSGILMPVFSLPNQYGIGDFGVGARELVDWLHEAGQKYWQILPLLIPDSLGSPYASPSSMAGNWLFIDPQPLVRKGWLLPQELRLIENKSAAKVNYPKVTSDKRRTFKQAFQRWLKAEGEKKQDFLHWQVAQKEWLPTATLFLALKDYFAGRPWWQWPTQWQLPSKAQAMLTPHLRRQQLWHTWLQWLFNEQWQSLHAYARRRGIAIIGDLPFYVQRDSVEVWAQPELFLLDRHRHQRVVAGVPPDVFSPTGQRWGNPLYAWSYHHKTKFAWWTQRMRQAFERYDLVRFDHFRGLVAAGHIPAKDQDGHRGVWVATPGRALLQHVQRSLHGLPLLAEDIGHLTRHVVALRHAFGLRGSRVLQFAWSGLPDNFHHPHEVEPDIVYYTSDHDTPTTRGWWERQARWYERRNVELHLGRHPRAINWDFIIEAYRSAAEVVIIPMADVLNLGQDGRINRPGTKRGNWRWRLRTNQVTLQQARHLRRVAKSEGRL